MDGVAGCSDGIQVGKAWCRRVGVGMASGLMSPMAGVGAAAVILGSGTRVRHVRDGCDGGTPRTIHYNLG